jgi:hypothetical protein
MHRVYRSEGSDGYSTGTYGVEWSDDVGDSRDGGHASAVNAVVWLLRHEGCVSSRGSILVSRAHRARDIVADCIRPYVPVGTLQWMAFPSRREAVAGYVARAVVVADCASAWAGGLRSFGSDEVVS